MEIAYKILSQSRENISYAIIKDEQKGGIIVHNLYDNSCKVIDSDLKEVLNFENTDASKCIDYMSKFYAHYYRKQNMTVTFDFELV